MPRGENPKSKMPVQYLPCRIGNLACEPCYLERGVMEPCRGSTFTEALHPSEKSELSLKAKLKASFSLLIR